MFDRVTVKPRRRMASLTAVVSIGVHVAAGLGLLALSFWKIDKIALRDPGLVMQQTGFASAPPPPSAAPAPAPAQRLKVAKARPDELTQPDRDPKPASDTPPGPVGPPGVGPPSDAPPCVGPQCDGPPCEGAECDLPPGETCANPPCEAPKPTPVVVEDKPAPTVIAQQMIEGQRILGDPQIRLPQPLLARLAGAGIGKLSTRVQVCLDTSGAPVSVTVQTSSGEPEVDALITSGVRTWRYRAYLVAGKAVPVCFPVVFRHLIER